MKPTSTRSKPEELNLAHQSNQSPYSSNKNSHTVKLSHERASDHDGRSPNSKMQKIVSPHRSDKTKDSKKDPFMFPAIERRYVIDDDNNADYEYEYESIVEEKIQKSLPKNKTHSKNSPRNKNSPRKQLTKKNSPHVPLSPRKREIKEKIKKLQAELRDLQSSVISGEINENSETMSEFNQKIDEKKRKIGELERLAELNQLEQKEQNDNRELLRRIEILERNQEELLSPKPKPNLGFMSPNDAIISIKAKPFDQPEEGSSLIKRRNQVPLNVNVPNKTKNKEEPQVQEREINLSSSEKKINESSFCKMNPINAKEFADKHLKDIITSNPKQYSSQPNNKSKNYFSTKNHQEQDEPASKYRSNHLSRNQEKTPDQLSQTNHRSNHLTKIQNEPPKSRQRTQNQNGINDLSVDVTIADVKKIPNVSAYCVIYTESTSNSPNKTKVASHQTDSNIFNETFHFPFTQSDPKSSVLVILIKKEDLIKGDKLIGSVRIDLNAVIRSMFKKKTNTINKSFPIISDTKVQTEGRLHLILKSDSLHSIKNINEIQKRPKKEPKKNDPPAKNKDSKDKKLQKVPASNKISDDHVLERNIELESEPSNKLTEQPKVQPNLKSSIVSLLSDHSSANRQTSTNKNERKENIPKEKIASNQNNTTSPRSSKYNWNNGSLIKNNKKKPIYEIVSEDDEEPNQENDSDAFDENAPALNPSSFPVPDIKYTPSVEGEIEREAVFNAQLGQSLQDILEQTGSPVRNREVDYDIENEVIFEEEEEEKTQSSLISETPLETVSEDEDQISNELDKAFGKEPPRLSSAHQSEVEFNFNKSEDAVTYNLANLSKYYQPRFINDDAAQRRIERKRKQKFNERQQPKGRSINLSDSQNDDEDEEIDVQIDYSIKKRPRITKVSNNDKYTDSDQDSTNDEKNIMLSISDDDEDKENNRKIIKKANSHRNDASPNENDSIGINEKGEDSNIHDSFSNSNKNADYDNKEPSILSEDESEKSTSSLSKPDLDCFNSNDNEKSYKSRNVNERFNQIEKVESENSPANDKSKLSTSSHQASTTNNSSLISLEASSFSDCSLKSSLDQFKFLDSVKKLSNIHEKDD